MRNSTFSIIAIFLIIGAVYSEEAGNNKNIEEILREWDTDEALNQYPMVKQFLRGRLESLFELNAIPWTIARRDPFAEVRGGEGSLQKASILPPQIYDTFGANFGQTTRLPPQIYDTAASFGQPTGQSSAGTSGGQTTRIPPQVYDTAASFGQPTSSGRSSAGTSGYASYGQTGQYIGGVPGNYLASLPFIPPLQNTISNQGNGGLLGGSLLTGSNGRQSLFNVLQWVFGNGQWVGPQTYGGTIQGPVVSAIPTSIPTGQFTSGNSYIAGFGKNQIEQAQREQILLQLIQREILNAQAQQYAQTQQQAQQQP